MIGIQSLRTNESVMKIPVFLLIGFAMIAGCDSADNSQMDRDMAVRSGDHELKGAPGIVPGDAGLHDITADVTAGWQAYDTYYRTLDTKYGGETFLDNLKWMTVEHMVRFSNFSEADEDIHRFYLNELIQRSFVNNPDVGLTILNQTKGLIDQERARFSHDMVMINEAWLERDEVYKKRHQDMHHEAYAALNAHAFNRWGESRYREVQ